MEIQCAFDSNCSAAWFGLNWKAIIPAAIHITIDVIRATVLAAVSLDNMMMNAPASGRKSKMFSKFGACVMILATSVLTGIKYIGAGAASLH